MAETGTTLLNIRVEHVGSLLRPQYLKEAFTRHLAGNMSGDELRAVQDRAVREVVAKQEAAGLPIVTDGEYRRAGFMESATKSLAGLPEPLVEPNEPTTPGARFEGTAVQHRQTLTGRISLRWNQPLEEYRFSEKFAKRPIKVTILGPDRLLRRHDPRSVYGTEEEYTQDFTDAYRQMVKELVAAGCRYIQIDGPEYTAYVDAPSLERMRAHGEDPEKNLARAIAMDNAIIADMPGVTFGLHICRGNRRSMHHREGSYDSIAERLFGSLNVHRFLLEYDTERAGGFEPLRFVPKGRVAVLGLVTTKFPGVERADELKRRLDEASRFLPAEQLALSPQCGFSSGLLGNVLDEDAQWRKLDVIRQVAQQFWGVMSGPV